MGVSPVDSFKAQKSNFMEGESFHVDGLRLFIKCQWQLLPWQQTILGLWFIWRASAAKTLAVCTSHHPTLTSSPHGRPFRRLTSPSIIPSSLSCLSGFSASRVQSWLANLLFEICSLRQKATFFVTVHKGAQLQWRTFSPPNNFVWGTGGPTRPCKGGGDLLSHHAMVNSRSFP